MRSIVISESPVGKKAHAIRKDESAERCMVMEVAMAERHIEAIGPDAFERIVSKPTPHLTVTTYILSEIAP